MESAAGQAKEAAVEEEGKDGSAAAGGAAAARVVYSVKGGGRYGHFAAGAQEISIFPPGKAEEGRQVADALSEFVWQYRDAAYASQRIVAPAGAPPFVPS